MAYTNFPSGVTSFGVPVIPGLGGVPLTGNWYFADYANGSDGNEGTAESPFKTITQAYSKTIDGNNDVVVIVSRPNPNSVSGSSTTGTQRLTETLVWANSATHLIGMTAPTVIGQRARIAPLTTATTNINPLVTVSGSGCIFSNFSLFQGIGQATTDEKLINITGLRNYFGNVDFGGMGHANGAARAGSYVVAITGGEENTFDGCTIGLDTIARSAANASVILRSNAARNVFRRCLFPLYATATSPYIIDANAANSVLRHNSFIDCTVINSGSSALAAAVAFHASQGGFTLIDRTTSMGVTAWVASSTATVKISTPAAAGSGAGGLATSV